MKSNIEQIKAILSWNAFKWAVNQLQPGETIDEKRYSDFISVTQQEVEEYVEKHGFPNLSVKVVRKNEGIFAEDQTCIVEGSSGWEVFYLERGQRSEQSLFPSFEEARREVIRRMLKSAKIQLNHRYRLAHPDLNLPLPSEMD